jgi:hypothetical protein
MAPNPVINSRPLSSTYRGAKAPIVKMSLTDEFNRKGVIEMRPIEFV